MQSQSLSYFDNASPHVMVVDGSRLIRKLISDVLKKEHPEMEVIVCENIKDAKEALDNYHINLVTTSLVLPDGSGMELARAVREAAGQAYVPVIVVSSNTQDHLEERKFTDDVTDYFDKNLGYSALAAFISGYVNPDPIPDARVLYVEDSRVVALATKRMLERQQIKVLHFVSVEEALQYLEEHRGKDDPGADLVLTDVYLKGELSGHDLLRTIRTDFNYSKRFLPVLVMTGDSNSDNQSALLKQGANDLVLKPIEERLLVRKTLFQLRLRLLKSAA